MIINESKSNGTSYWTLVGDTYEFNSCIKGSTQRLCQDDIVNMLNNADKGWYYDSNLYKNKYNGMQLTHNDIINKLNNELY